MLRRLPALCVVLWMLASVVPAKAQWFGDFVHTFPRDYHRNNCWPEPFVTWDREAVCAPFGPMVANGWRQQTLLSAHHFSEDGKLTRAGEEKVYWILTQVPAHRRTIYVERGRTAAQTTRRLDVVQQSAAAQSQGGEMPPVVDTHVVVQGRSGQTVYDLFVKFPQSQPAPVLPAPTADAAESK